MSDHGPEFTIACPVCRAAKDEPCLPVRPDDPWGTVHGGRVIPFLKRDEETKENSDE